MRKTFFNACLSCLLLLFFVIGSGLFLFAPSNGAGTTTVGVFPSSVTAILGQNFSININATGISDLYGWQFTLNWTARILNVVNASEGPFLKSGGSTFFYYNSNASAGQVTVECTLLGDVSGMSGSGVLATITFSVISSGQSSLNLYNAILLNSNEQAIPVQLSGGDVYALSPPDVAVTSVNVSPIVVLPGSSVHINATVENLGGFSEIFNVTTYANSHVIGVQNVALNNGSSQTLFFTWNTTGYSEGDYNVSAVASKVPGEMNTTNNVKAAANIVTILYDGHYVAVTTVNPGKTVIGQGYSTNIKVKVKNYGIYTESFNTTAYINNMALQTQEFTLESGAATTINFTWNTAGFVYGNCTISTSITLAPSETNNGPSKFVYGVVILTIPGDINGDGTVNSLDFHIFASYWLERVPPAPANVDIGGYGVVSAKDFHIIAQHWLHSWKG